MTEGELIEALRAAMPEVDDDAWTTDEIAGSLGVSLDTARRRIKPLVRAGKMQVVRKMITDMGGRTVPVPAYRLA